MAKSHELSVYFSTDATKHTRGLLSATSRRDQRLVPQIQTVMPEEDKTFGGSLVLDDVTCTQSIRILLPESANVNTVCAYTKILMPRPVFDSLRQLYCGPHTFTS